MQLKTSLQYTQLECGTQRPFYEQSFKKIGHVITPTWITNLWQYCDDCKVTLHEHTPWL